MASSQPVPPPPIRSLADRAFDILIWGGLALLLIVGFRGAEVFKIGDLFARD